MSSETTSKDKSKQGSNDNTKSAAEKESSDDWQNVKLDEEGNPEAPDEEAAQRLRESPELITEQEATEEFTQIDGKDVPKEENLDANGKPYGGFVATSKPMRRGGFKGADTKSKGGQK